MLYPYNVAYRDRRENIAAPRQTQRGKRSDRRPDFPALTELRDDTFILTGGAISKFKIGHVTNENRY